MKTKKYAFTAAAAAVLALCAPLTAYAIDAFNPLTNLLTIDQIRVNGLGTYKDVRATVHSYSLLHVDNGWP